MDVFIKNKAYGCVFKVFYDNKKYPVRCVASNSPTWAGFHPHPNKGVPLPCLTVAKMCALIFTSKENASLCTLAPEQRKRVSAKYLGG